MPAPSTDVHVISVCATLTAQPDARNSPFAYCERSSGFWYTEMIVLSISAGPKFDPVIVTVSSSSPEVVCTRSPLSPVMVGTSYDDVSFDAIDV